MIDLDDEGEAEVDRQASEAEERRGDNSSSNQAPQDISNVPSSTPSSMPSSSHQRRITPITWERSPQRFHRGSLIFVAQYHHQ